LEGGRSDYSDDIVLWGECIDIDIIVGSVTNNVLGGRWTMCWKIQGCLKRVADMVTKVLVSFEGEREKASPFSMGISTDGFGGMNIIYSC